MKSNPKILSISTLFFCSDTLALVLPSIVLIIALLSFPKPVSAQASNQCPINPFLGGRELHIEGPEGNKVYIVCVDLTFQYLRFETVMAGDTLNVNPHPDQRETVVGMVSRDPHKSHQPVVAFNADYFGSGHGPEGLTVVNGIRIDGPQNGDCDNRNYKDCRDNATYRASLSISRINAVEISHKTAEEVDEGIVQLSRLFTSVGGGPILVQNGVAIENPCSIPYESVTAHNCSDTQQTAVGLSADGQTLIIVVAESKTGEEMGEILVRYGAATGMKLDGGGSSQLWFEGKKIYYDQSEGINGRPVANAILIFREQIPRHYLMVVMQSEFPIVGPGETVEISFELQNSGFLTWKKELPYALRFTSDERINLPKLYLLEGDIPPGGTLGWSQSIIAPMEPGTYQIIGQMSYDGDSEHVEEIGPKIGFIITVLPKGSPPNLESAIQQLIDAAQMEAQETLEDFLSRLEDAINKRIEQELKKITICGQPVFGLLALGLMMGKTLRKRY
jgi:exopolysaccharide biosynthesis protein